MDWWGWVIVIVVILAGLALVGWGAMQKRRSDALHERFGPEYERTVRERGGRRDAEAELTRREERRSTLDIKPLSEDARRDYAKRWERSQATFVDSPYMAIAEADVLVQSVMRDRGYPVLDSDQRMADVSVDHPDVMDHFRAATRIAASAREQTASTEELRQAMVHYRELFRRLLGEERDTPARRSA